MQNNTNKQNTISSFHKISSMNEPLQNSTAQELRSDYQGVEEFAYKTEDHAKRNFKTNNTEPFKMDDQVQL